MATFVRDDVVIIPFPFSGLSNAKRRPALVVAALAGDDLILARSQAKVFATNMLYRLKTQSLIPGPSKLRAILDPIAFLPRIKESYFTKLVN